MQTFQEDSPVKRGKCLAKSREVLREKPETSPAFSGEVFAHEAG
jgi:hypothetical protein